MDYRYRSALRDDKGKSMIGFVRKYVFFLNDWSMSQIRFGNFQAQLAVIFVINLMGNVAGLFLYEVLSNFVTVTNSGFHAFTLCYFILSLLVIIHVKSERGV